MKNVRWVWLLTIFIAAGVAANGPWRASEENTRGWQLMTPEERIAHQAKIRSFTALADCLAYQAEHHRLMEARARVAGLPPPSGGRDLCAHLRPASPP
mgnify:CR=1 FL=1